MTPVQPTADPTPREGMLATVRNRRAVVVGVDPYDAPDEGRVHVVRLEYTDPDGPSEDAVVWEREVGTSLLEPRALPDVAGEAPMVDDDFDALVRAARWTALSPFLDPDDGGPLAAMPIAAPLFGAVQAEDFQLVPLLMALQSPRVSLLLADDVGLGKTIEAGLILTELLRRRRVRRVLILCPAALRTQWRDEMAEKFALSFDLVDRESTHALQRRMGLDVNPWRTFPRIIASYYYLRQPDILESFAAACRQPEGAYSLPWDLLIVDEAHNLMPAAYGSDSELVRMLRLISPWFEHRLFLTATPHNGQTRSFTGLLELLDPVRFAQTSELDDELRKRVDEAVVRRLKRDVNDLDDRLDRPRRFPERHVTPLPLYFGRRELAVHESYGRLRQAIRAWVTERPANEQTAGVFAVEVLGKRLLSCPSTFAASWWRFTAGLRGADEASLREVEAARRASDADLEDDEEREGRVAHATGTVGAWMRPLAGDLREEIEQVDSALADLGLDLSPAALAGEEATGTPSADARFDRLCALIDERLRLDRAWRDDERLIVFTEFKTSLDYVVRRLRERYDRDDSGRVTELYGGMNAIERDAIKAAFNDPEDRVRVLVATDAASEGLNLQATARLVMHWDIPWNPVRLEQRNGRLDRHGQARDVTVFHFTSEQDDDLRFLAYVVQKVHTIREDLGNVGEIFDAAFERRFADLDDVDRVEEGLEADVDREISRTQWLQQGVGTDGHSERERLDELCRHIDLSPDTLRTTLERALGMGIGHPRLDGPDQRGRFRLLQPIPPGWTELVDDSLRRPVDGASLGALPGLIFDPMLFVTTAGERPVFRPTADTALLHLGHPVFRRALTQLMRARFPGSDVVGASRWTARRGEVPDGAQALVLVTVEELAVNELREPLHHWVRTLRFPVAAGRLLDPQPTIPAADEEFGNGRTDQDDVRAAQRLWQEVELDVRDRLTDYATTLTKRLQAHAETAGANAIGDARSRFRDRRREVAAAVRETTLARLERERERIEEAMQQRALLGEIERERQARLRDLEEELRRRRDHYGALLQRLEAEEARTLERILPRRYALRGDAQVLPVAVEVRLP